jgi:hypothetical protein
MKRWTRAILVAVVMLVAPVQAAPVAQTAMRPARARRRSLTPAMVVFRAQIDLLERVSWPR